MAELTGRSAVATIRVDIPVATYYVATHTFLPLRSMLHRILRGATAATAFVATAILTAACSGDPVAPSAADAPAFLLGPDEGVRVVSDSVDANGNTILVQEFAAGVYTLPSGEGGSVASVTIRSFIPAWPAGTTVSSTPCITNSIVSTDAAPGNTLSIKKSGGCDKDVVVLIEQKATKRKATFSFSMVFGKTVIDAGLLR